MKIISKTKDYYDYLMGVNGIDDKIVLDRTSFTPTETFHRQDTPEIYSFFIAGYKIQVLRIGIEFYCGDKLKPFDMKKRVYGYSPYDNVSIYIEVPKFNFSTNILPNKVIDKESINQKLNCPILLQVGGMNSDCLKFGSRNFKPFPLLKDYNISHLIKPQEMWDMLYNWISANKEKPTEQPTNSIKIISHGFDLKSSFRPNMK